MVVYAALGSRLQFVGYFQAAHHLAPGAVYGLDQVPFGTVINKGWQL